MRCRACHERIDRDREHVRVQFKPYARLVAFHRACFDAEKAIYYRITYVSNREPLLLTEQDP